MPCDRPKPVRSVSHFYFVEVGSARVLSGTFVQPQKAVDAFTFLVFVVLESVEFITWLPCDDS